MMMPNTPLVRALTAFALIVFMLLLKPSNDAIFIVVALWLLLMRPQ